MHILRSPREIAQMRKAGLVVWQAHQIAAALVRPGVTTGEIDAAVERFFDDRGAIPAVQGRARQGPLSGGHLHLGQRRSGARHPRHRACWPKGTSSASTPAASSTAGAATRPSRIPVGKIEPEVQRLLDVTSGVLELAIELMGKQAPLERGGRARWRPTSATPAFRWSRASSGHGIGREMHEDPQVPNFVSAQLRAQRRFPPGAGPGDRGRADGQHGDEAGQDACRTTGRRSPQDGQPSAHFEHTIAITDDGPWVLTGPAGAPAKAAASMRLPAGDGSVRAAKRCGGFRADSAAIWQSSILVRGLERIGRQAVYIQALCDHRPKSSSCMRRHESPRQRQANLRKLQDRPPPRRGVRRLQQSAPQAAAGLEPGSRQSGWRRC